MHGHMLQIKFTLFRLASWFIYIYIYNSLFSNSLSRRKKDSHSRCGLSFQKPIHPIADCSFGLLSLFSAIQVTGLPKTRKPFNARATKFSGGCSKYNSALLYISVCVCAGGLSSFYLQGPIFVNWTCNFVYNNNFVQLFNHFSVNPLYMW